MIAASNAIQPPCVIYPCRLRSAYVRGLLGIFRMVALDSASRIPPKPFHVMDVGYVGVDELAPGLDVAWRKSPAAERGMKTLVQTFADGIGRSLTTFSIEPSYASRSRVRLCGTVAGLRRKRVPVTCDSAHTARGICRIDLNECNSNRRVTRSL